MKSSLSTAEIAELALVDAHAAALRAHLLDEAPAVAAAHVHGAQSKTIQVLVSRILRSQLGFAEERVLTKQDGLVVNPRPDFVYRLGRDRGIIAEVERGGTTTNNHDLKDMWKAHISADTQHLFLVVPQNNWKADGTPREKAYSAVVRRLGAFFGDPRRELDVVSAHIFGY
ncbi:MAG: hypothetical protein ACJ71Z_04555 [Aeromicrobium sp.]